MDDKSVTRWLESLKGGSEGGADALWQRYFGKLVNLARRALRDAPRRVADEEDIALSAFDSFCQGVARGQYPRLDDRDDLWKILVTLTVRKASNQRRRDRAQKRGGGIVRGESVFASREKGGGIDLLASADPTPEFAALMAERCRDLLATLDENLRQIALLKLEGHSNEAIAERLDVVPRTIERKLDRIRQRWAKDAPP